jgi:hypothetical protein
VLTVPSASNLTRAVTRLGLLLATSCTGGLQGNHFHKREADYRLGVLGAEWRPVRAGGMDVVFHRPGHGSIGAHATCRDYEDVPASVLLGHLLFGTTERVYVLEEVAAVDGRGAHHAIVDAELDGVPVRLEVYVLTRAPCVFDLSYVSGREARGRGEFLRFVRSFHVEAVHDG